MNQTQKTPLTTAEINRLLKERAKDVYLAKQRGRRNFRSGFDKMHPATQPKKEVRA